MKTLIDDFTEFISEAKGSPFAEFAQKRHDGAKKIAEGAKQKGGPAMLTYYHFIVKLPYYKKAAAGRFDAKSSTQELRKLNRELAAILKTFEPRDQIPFQKVMGKIEVVGELLIKHSEAL
jgi:hypothetical protein